LAYLAPEQRNGAGYTSLVDVFAVGLVGGELCGLSVPFNPDLDISLELSRRNYSGQLSNTIKLCIAEDPKNRPNFHQLIALDYKL
jgi:serine/threonine protein kinase